MEAASTNWNGGRVYKPGGLIDLFAGMSDTTMVIGTVAGSIPLAFGILLTAPVSLPTMG